MSLRYVQIPERNDGLYATLVACGTYERGDADCAERALQK